MTDTGPIGIHPRDLRTYVHIDKTKGREILRTRRGDPENQNHVNQLTNQPTNPFIVIGGDFNRKDIEEAIGDFPDITCVTNFNDCLKETLNHPLLENEEGRKSDHNFITYFPL